MSDERNEKLTRADFVAELEDIWEECAQDTENFSEGPRAEIETALKVLRMTYTVTELLDLDTLCQA